MDPADVLFWLIVIPTIVVWTVLEVRLYRSRRKPVVMMARPMTKYEREHR